MPGYLDIPAQKMRVVPIGINLQGFDTTAVAKKNGFTVGFLGRIAPEKGLHLLAEAYKLFRKQNNGTPARLEAAGWIAPECKPYLDAIRKDFEQSGLASEFSYRGVLERDQKIDFLRQLDVMSVPATYDEPKGVSLLEAMACGVPLVQPRRGAFTEIVEKTSGGLLVEPDNAQSLADGLLEIFRDQRFREKLGRDGAQGVRQHYSSAHMADRALEAYEKVIRDRAAAGP
jgi:glycosyltransferase involved in cell wall biosynthesis